jgi:hypothetical protein
MWDIACMQCDKPQARWSLGDPSSYHPGAVEETSLPICSLCFMFRSKWGRDNNEKIAALIGDIEFKIGSPFKRDPEGKLLHIADADRILQSVALISRIHGIKRIRNRAMGRDILKETFN